MRVHFLSTNIEMGTWDLQKLLKLLGIYKSYCQGANLLLVLGWRGGTLNNVY